MKRLPRLRARHLALGRAGERDARRLLEAEGCVFLASDWRCRYGELDLVMRDGETIVFVEVKTRRRRSHYRPVDNLSLRQLRRNVRAGREYLHECASPAFPCRYDLVEVIRGFWFCREIHHRRNFIDPKLLQQVF